jgi:FG-GAP repeat
VLVERVVLASARQEVVEMRRIIPVLVLALGIGVWPSGQRAMAVQAAPARSLQADFNNDGAADLAIGVPFEFVGAIQDAGAVNVLYGSAGGLQGPGSQFFTQDTPGVPGSADAQDNLGSGLATGDFNRDGFADLAIGVPGEDIGTIGSAGAVIAVYGSAGGLTTTGAQLLIQAGGATELNDAFGGDLAAGDFNHDGFADLAASVSGEDVGSVLDAGAVSVLPGSPGGLTTVGGRLFTQVGGAVEAEDFFGDTLATGDFDQDGFADLAAGARFEDVGTAESAGAVSVLYGSPTGLTRAGGRLFTQVGGAAELQDFFGTALAAGDFDQDGFADLAAGAPGEDVGSAFDAGAVSVLRGSSAGLTRAGARLFTQVASPVEAEDGFGAALATGDFDDDGFADLATGAPGEEFRSGVVSVLFGSAAGLTRVGGQVFSQVGGAVETNDAFGGSLAAADYDQDGFADLAAGAPFETVGSVLDAGAVSVLYGSVGGLTRTGGQLFTQNSPGLGSSAEALDNFGLTLAAGASGPQIVVGRTIGKPVAEPEHHVERLTAARARTVAD